MKHAKKLLLGGLALSVLSCDPGPGGSRGADEYVFETKEYTKKTVTITLEVFENQEALDKYARDNNINVQGLAAFGKLRPSVNECTIYVVDPANKYEPEFIGHEVAHCFWGRWHPSRDKAALAAGERNIP